MSTVLHPKAHTVFSGGSTDWRSPYATTAAVSYRGLDIPARPPASPWMGDHQSRHGYRSSGYQSAYFRDKPAGGGSLEDQSTSRDSFARPLSASLAETQPWTGEKDAQPLTSCLRRGEVKEPRFYPFKMGSEHGAHALIQPPEVDTYTRFDRPPIAGSRSRGALDSAAARMVKPRGLTTSGFSLGNSATEVGALITERQGQAEGRTPALTMLESERVSADSTRRYFHARDYYESPFMTSNQYYQQDVLAQHAEMKRKKQSLTAVPALRPLTQFAAQRNEAPFAPDVGSPRSMPQIGEGVEAAWGVVPPESSRVGLMPTAFSLVGGLSPGAADAADDPPSAAASLPERFARMRARHDYLKWGGATGPGGENTGMYLSTSRVELKKPREQIPLGGVRKEPEGARVVATDASGYHMQISKNPIVPRE